jgi:pilus assembly protein Flp/PilA
MGTIFMDQLLTYLRDEQGASAAEYALILAIVGTAIAGAAIILGHNISTAINSAATCVKTPTGC